MSVFPGEIVNICWLGKSKCRRLDFGLSKAFVGEAGPGLAIGADFYEGQFEEGVKECIFENGEIESVAICNWRIKGEGCDSTITERYYAVGRCLTDGGLGGADGGVAGVGQIDLF